MTGRTLVICVLAGASLVGGCGPKDGGVGSSSSKPAAASRGSASAAKEEAKCADPKAKMFDKGGFCLTLPEGVAGPKEDKDGQWVVFAFEATGEWESVTVQRMDPPRVETFDATKTLVLGDDEKKDKKVVEDGPTPDGKGFVLITEKEPNRRIAVLTKSNKNIYRCSTWTSSSKPKEGQLEICKSLTPIDR